MRLREPLLQWYGEHRRHLPWREEVTPYRTWVSEIMLQQTRVAAAAPYFARFMSELPTVQALAEVEQGRLMKLWEGLGYYSRAKNLQRTAQLLMQEWGGELPRSYRDLVALPGIGDYTAGAILSIAYGIAEPAVDGNVLRIVARLTAEEGEITDAAVKRKVRAAVAQTMSREHPGAYNQALMDLGAMICTPNGEPLCEQCPAREFCIAHAEGRAAELPLRAKKKARRVEEMTVLLLRREGKTALRQRGDEGLLASLWEFPHLQGQLDEEQTAAALHRLGIRVREWEKCFQAKHVFTHVQWQMRCYVLQVEGESPSDWVWMERGELSAHAVPSAFEKCKREALQ